MADPATPTIQDRAETLAVARQWLDAVREDRPVRVDIRAIYGDTNGFVTALCQEVTLLAEQLAAMTAARDEACTLLQRLIDAQERYSPPAVSSSEAFAAMKREIDKRIDGLRKVGAL